MIYELGPAKEFQLDTDRRTLTRNGANIPLNRKAFETLRHLVQNAGKVVRREELIDAVWGPVATVPAVVDQNIHTLRQALKEERSRHQYIETVRGVGFVFIAPVFVVHTIQAKDPYRRLSTIIDHKYLLARYVGRGGMGAVYEATLAGNDRESLNSIVAIKLLKPDLVLDHPDYVELFRREVEAVKKLNHPNIVKLIDNGVTDDGIPFMAMEWLVGETLEDVIARDRLSVQSILEISKQVCDAFSFAHANHIIHLDVKPSNIFVQNYPHLNQIKVIDFGMARVIRRDSGTTASRFLGTWQYCSPEHFGGKVSKRSDVYSLGASLYHLIAGVLPFGGSYIHAKMHANLELPTVPPLSRIRPDIPEAVDAVIHKALSRDPNLRHQDVDQLFADLLDALEPKKQVSRRFGWWVRKHN